ncbi:ANTAR domain-containing protein [Cryobacterium zongtaii]|uniref:ANTAR domain-containing protein n=1 Tax=Cryobacterium zongtaii TaxID=1259217 RepID=UPI0013FD86C0
MQHALNSRILIEHAKGVVVESAEPAMDEAFVALRKTCAPPQAHPHHRGHRGYRPQHRAERRSRLTRQNPARRNGCVPDDDKN